MIRNIQPQVNAYECSFISEDSKTTFYWDRGISKVNEFLQEHDTTCNTNWVCKALKLKAVVVRSKTPEPVTQASRSSLSHTTHGF